MRMGNGVMGLRVLITGGAGFVGSHIAEAWQNDAEILILDNLRSGYRENIQGFKVRFVQGDITDPGLVDSLCQGIDLIYHEAALVSVVESIQKPVLTEQINIIGLLNLLESAKKHRVPRVVFASSAAVYGNNESPIQHEDLLPHPMSPYAVSKVGGEHYMALYSLLHGVSTVCLRNFNIFGPRQDPHSPYASVIPIFIGKALKNEDLVIYGDGCQTRDFIYVKDVAAANVFLGLNRYEGVLNIATGYSISITQLAETIIEMTGSTGQIRYATERPGEVRHSVADVNRATQAGFKTQWDLRNALQETIDFYAGHSN